MDYQTVVKTDTMQRSLYLSNSLLCKEQLEYKEQQFQVQFHRSSQLNSHCPCQSTAPHRALWGTSQFLGRKAPFCSKTSREPFTYWKVTFKVKFVPQQALSHFTQQRPHHSRMVLPRWGHGRNDWVTSPGQGEGVCSLKQTQGCSQTEKERQGYGSKYLNTFFPCRLMPFSSVHQMNALTSPPNHVLHSQGHCQSSPWYKGQRKETFAASSLAILCCGFCQNTGLKLFHTQPAKGLKLHLYWHWFQYQPTNTSRGQLLDRCQILKANMKGSEYF